MATFDLNSFIKQPSLEGLKKCRKDDFFHIAQHFEIPVSKTALKRDLKACLTAGLIDRGVVPAENIPEKSGESLTPVADERSLSSDGEPVTPVVPRREVGASFSLPKFEPLTLSSTGGSSPPRENARLKVRLARVRLEMQDKAQARKDELQHELERYRIDAEMRIKMRQLELQISKNSIEGQISAALQVNDDSTTAGLNPASAVNDPDSDAEFLNAPTPQFNVAKNIVIIPPFREKEVEAYFQAFERIATALKWPKEVWALMLQCKLTGKAQEVCAALPLEESVQYEVVKNAILRAYELVPEHYRQRFRMMKKSAAQTYVEFSREKGILFDRWVKAL